MDTIQQAAAALEAGTTTARALVEDCLSRISDPSGEGARTFLRVYADAARAMADCADTQRRAGRAPSMLAGIPISLKDLFDVAGETTAAGSVVLRDAPPARAHSTVVARCLGAGLIPLGRTNMTEFAFSGLGLNPHFGTPAAPWDRATRRMPGGSSSGAAVSVADGMAFAGLGSDTGGSCRIPAAMCGIVGYKPTARRVPRDGVLPLSSTLDSIGPLARSVGCCAAIDAVLAGAPLPAPGAVDIAGIRLAVVENVMFDGIDDSVARAFDRAIAALEHAGARIVRRRFASFDEIALANRTGGLTAPEAFAWHRKLLAEHGDGFDQMVRQRIERGGTMTAADYIDTVAARAAIIARANAETESFDALVMPTCPLEPAPIAKLEADASEYVRVNMLQLRNTAVGNFLDRCAVSLPCNRAGDPPAGFMVMGETLGDSRLFRIAGAIETVLSE